MSLVAVNHERDILPELNGTAVEDLLLNHNIGTAHGITTSRRFSWEPAWISASALIPSQFCVRDSNGRSHFTL